MINNALEQLSQLTEQLIDKNALLAKQYSDLESEHLELKNSIEGIKEENETLQLEALEQEEKQSST